jgi:tight adherence protein B
VLLIDTSGSMHGAAIRSALQGGLTFVRTRNPSQPVGIVFFSSTPQVAAPMTTDSAVLANALAAVPPLGAGTHIYDAAASALGMLKKAKITGGSIVVLSDGQDSGSQLKEQALATAASAQGVRVYTVGVHDPSFQGATLQSLASSTKGVYTSVDSGGLVAFYRSLGLELSNQYLIHYRSTAPLGQPVKVAVRVAGGVAYADYTTPAIPSAVNLAPGPKHSSFWSSTLGAVLVSVACALLVGLAVLALTKQRSGVRSRVSEFVATLAAGDVPEQRSLVQRALGEPRARRRIERSGWWNTLALELDVASIAISPGRLVAMTAISTLLLGWLLVGATSSILAGAIALAVPLGVRVAVSVLADRRRREFDEQLPDNLQVISSAMRAGHTFMGALAVVVEDAPEPSRRELGRALADEQLGMPLADALGQVSSRMSSRDFEHVTLVATLQRDTGGNTAEVLDLVTETIRDRLDLRRLVRALTAQGRLAGGILSVLPIGLLAAVSLINPHYVRPLFHRPAGIAFLIVAGIMMLSGAMIIRRIVDIEV